MKPLIVLLLVFTISLMATKLFNGNFDLALSGRVAMSAMLIFTAIGHFIFTKGMSLMLPSFVPYGKELVYCTGILEIAAAIGLFVPSIRVVVAWLLIAFLILVLPANIHATLKHVDHQTGTFTGNGPSYLWFRIPLQLLFVVWVYLSAIKWH